MLPKYLWKQIVFNILCNAKLQRFWKSFLKNLFMLHVAQWKFNISSARNKLQVQSDTQWPAGVHNQEDIENVPIFLHWTMSLHPDYSIIGLFWKKINDLLVATVDKYFRRIRD